MGKGQAHLEGEAGGTKSSEQGWIVVGEGTFGEGLKYVQGTEIQRVPKEGWGIWQ